MMNPSKSGWIRKYFSLLETMETALGVYPQHILSTEELFYGYIQPTGIMYGYPTQFLFLSNEFLDSLSKEEAFKVLLLEGLILSEYLQKGKFELSSIEDSLSRFVEFYESTEIETAKRNWLNFKEKDVYGKLESIINRRVDIKTGFNSKIWSTYLYNSLVFHDLLFFTAHQTGIAHEKIMQQRRKVAMDVMRIISAAAQSDCRVSDEEEAIFDVFMASADFTKEEREEIKDFHKNRGSLADIDLNYERSWLLNRYLLEIAVLTVWSDRVVVQAELDFLIELTKKLGIEEEEHDKSFIAIQAFVMNNYATVPFLSGKKDAELFMSSATERVKSILGRNKDQLAAELKESKELLGLIAKSTTEELSKEEKERARAQLKDLARAIPSLTLFMLPGGSLLLPIILKIIPDLIPTAFRSNQIETEEPKKKEKKNKKG